MLAAYLCPLNRSSHFAGHGTTVSMPCRNEVKVEAFMKQWSCPQVRLLLTGPVPAVLPTSGPLYELLKAAQHLVDRKPEQLLNWAVSCGDVRFVGVLAKILTWLQQQPDQQMHSAQQAEGLPWYDIAGILARVVAAAAEMRHNDNIRLVFKELNGAEGNTMLCFTIQERPVV